MVQQFGFLDTEYISFLNAQTEAAVRDSNAAGVSYAELYRILNGALTALAGSRDPLIAKYATDTTEKFITQKLGSKRMWYRGAEYTPGRPQVGAGETGYELPLWNFEMDLGTTNRAMRDMTADAFYGEVRDTIQGIAKGYRADVLERIFHALEFPLDSRAIAGNSPGFAGVGEAVVGLDRHNVALEPDYTHYLHGADTTAGIQGALNGAIARIERHHDGRVEILPTEEMAARITAMTADEMFVPAQTLLIRSAIDRPEALVPADRYLGVYAMKYPVLHPEPQVVGLAAAVAPVNPSRKPIAWRYEPRYGRHARVEDRSLFPLTEAVILQDYGVGVYDRFGMALVSAGTGTTYINPTVVR